MQAKGGEDTEEAAGVTMSLGKPVQAGIRVKLHGGVTCFDCHVNGSMASADGPIKTFPLRGIKDSPPYLHDGRLLTLEDTVEFFNLIQELKLTAEEKADLVAFLRALWASTRPHTAPGPRTSRGPGAPHLFRRRAVRCIMTG